MLCSCSLFAISISVGRVNFTTKHLKTWFSCHDPIVVLLTVVPALLVERSSFFLGHLPFYFKQKGGAKKKWAKNSAATTHPSLSDPHALALQQRSNADTRSKLMDDRAKKIQGAASQKDRFPHFEVRFSH